MAFWEKNEICELSRAPTHKLLPFFLWTFHSRRLSRRGRCVREKGLERFDLVLSRLDLDGAQVARSVHVDADRLHVREQIPEGHEVPLVKVPHAPNLRVGRVHRACFGVFFKKNHTKWVWKHSASLSLSRETREAGTLSRP